MRPGISLTIILIFVVFACRAQEDKQHLLNKIDSSVNSLNEGEFDFHDTHSKIAVGEDSTKGMHVYNCYFKKQPADSLVGYQLASFNNGQYQNIYDGVKLWTVANGTLETTDRATHPEKISLLKTNYYVYPLFKYINDNLQRYNKDTMLKKIRICDTELYKGERCYKIQEQANGSEGSKVEAYYYVAVKSDIPIGEIISIEKNIGRAKEILTFDYWISDFKEVKLADNQFTKGILSGYNKEREYDPSFKENPDGLLPKGTAAPDWELPLVNGGKMKLSDLKGKIVVMDFWFKACAPCQEQMIELEKLNKKYNIEKVVFIGINTTDDPAKDKLTLFLQKRNISMLTVYNGKNIAGLYQAPYSPALFVIDKGGKVIYALDGTSDTLLKDVSEVIDKNL